MTLHHVDSFIQSAIAISYHNKILNKLDGLDLAKNAWRHKYIIMSLIASHCTFRGCLLHILLSFITRNQALFLLDGKLSILVFILRLLMKYVEVFSPLPRIPYMKTLLRPELASLIASVKASLIIMRVIILYYINTYANDSNHSALY